MNDAPSPAGFGQGISQVYLHALQNVAQAINGLNAAVAAALTGPPDNSVTTAKIVNDAVTNAKLANMADSTIKGRAAAAGTGDPQDLTAAQVKTILALLSTDLPDFTEASQDVVGALLTASESAGDLDWTYADASDTLNAVVKSNVITDAKLRQGAARSVIGVTGNATANVADIQGAADQVLRVNGAGTALAFGQTATGGITDAAVTYAKMQNVSTNARVLGRNTAGAGVTEEVTLSQMLDFVGSAANGDILYRSGGSWTRLPIGSNTNVLTVASSLPSWAAPASSDWVKLTSGSVSSAATLDLVLTSYTSYRALKFVITGWRPATDATTLWLRVSTNGGSTYDAGTGYEWSAWLGDNAGTGTNGGAASVAQIVLTGAGVQGSTTARSGNYEVTLPKQTSTTFNPQVLWLGTFVNNAGTVNSITGAGHRTTAQDTDAVRFLFSSGNISVGDYAVYGLT